MDSAMVYGVAIIAGFIGFLCGLEKTSWPTDQQMLDHLIRSRVARKLEALTRQDVEEEIERASARIVGA